METKVFTISQIVTGPGVSRVSIRGQFGFPELGGEVISIELSNTTSPCYVQKVDLSSGNNTITKPSSAGAVLILPPTGNAATISFRGVAGDTGVALSVTAPTLVSLSSSVTTFVLTTGAAIVGVQLIWI